MKRDGPRAVAAWKRAMDARRLIALTRTEVIQRATIGRLPCCPGVPPLPAGFDAKEAERLCLAALGALNAATPKGKTRAPRLKDYARELARVAEIARRL